MGYPLEKHYYTTRDGYINTVYRIPGTKGMKSGKIDNAYDPNRPVVIYQHGLLDSCMSLVANEEHSLGLMLVNEGFDLWLNNSRGNRYSREHPQNPHRKDAKIETAPARRDRVHLGPSPSED